MRNQWDIDFQNDRVVGYLPHLEDAEIHRVIETVEKKEDAPGKTIIYTIDGEGDLLRKHGFSLEAKLSGFYHGKDASIFTRYNKEERMNSKTSTENKEVLKLVEQDGKKPTKSERDFEVTLATDNDLEDLAGLFKMVFPVYPTNVFDPGYLKKTKETNYVYMVAKDQGKVVGAASAMDTGFKSAEITDCAVHPAYRGKQILNSIVNKLEGELVRRGIFNAFSLTRAKSVGMNMTVSRLNYQYEGTLINNCVISTGFEDMNIWTKRL